MAICLHSVNCDHLSIPLEGVDLRKLTYTLVNFGTFLNPLNIDHQSEETITSCPPDLKQLHSGNCTKM